MHPSTRTSPLNATARTRHLFLEVYGRQLRALDPTRELGDEDVRTAIKNSSGTGGEHIRSTRDCARALC